MNSRIKYILLVVCLLSLIRCEERSIINDEFPYDNNKIFCEIIGYANLGFSVTISKVQPVQDNGLNNIITDIKIWEEGILIIEKEVQGNILIEHMVDPKKAYQLEIRYEDQVLKSNIGATNLPKITMNNFKAKNSFIDSLQINVVETSFDFGPYETSDSIYFIPNYSLYYIQNNATRIGEFLKPKLVPKFEHIYINHLIANTNNKPFLRTSLLVINRSFYQYLKNIVQLGQIPNDHIDGHHGNIEGGVGYFGIVNIDTRTSPL